ncbi:hypothetical protein EV193_104366 [Herbihabitans rhizosphaerae]|uniref:Major tail protein n=1 Tax=Herbihabitans rhizosphaerae TaxID=1872711 RepID=A0A4Q7KSP5_9PSEU|nr:hypothetical protein [Herbihabitans rhizosphaerae]RZS39150.1 hypothetical protein EV193_104366 [Herbihabitans rhizosphaerae]
MALNDDAVLIPGTGHIYLAPVNTVEPVAPTAPTTPWVEVGHTSLEEGLSISREGGDPEVKGTWQSTALRERREPTVWSIGFQVHQVDRENLGLFFGAGTVTAGRFGVSANPTPTEHALYVRMVDGANEIGLWIPKVSLFANDDVEVDPENFLSFPVRATVLSVTGEDLMAWLSDEIVVAP